MSDLLPVSARYSSTILSVERDQLVSMLDGRGAAQRQPMSAPSSARSMNRSGCWRTNSAAGSPMRQLTSNENSP
jgi:hypothetical protein